MPSALVLLLFALTIHTCAGDPTTPHIKHIFLGKCLERNPQKDGEEYCHDSWSSFEPPAMMDMERVKDKDWDDFFALGDFSTPAGNALFWSGTKDFAGRLSADGTMFTTLEETLTGYVLNGLVWCGKAYQAGVPPAFDFTNSCDFMQNTSYYGNQGVWMRCSQRFAQSASGQVNVLLQPQRLNYNSGPYMAYRNTSIFNTIELPNMNTNLVTSMRILLIVDLDNAPTETCGNGSLLQLSNDVYRKFGFVPQCVDDPEDILEILCEQQDGTSPECAVASRCKNPQNFASELAAESHAKQLSHAKLSPAKLSPANHGLLVWAIMGSCVSAVLFAVVVVLGVRVLQKKQDYTSL